MTEQPLDVRAYARILGRRPILIATAGLLGTAAALAYGVMRPPLPAAQALVILPAVGTSTDAPATRDMKTQIEVATSSPILDSAGRAVTPHLNSAVLDKRVTVSALSDDVLSIVARAPKPADAVTLANVVANGYVSYAKGTTSASTDEAMNQLFARADQLKQQVSQLQDEINMTSSRLAGEDPSAPSGQSDAQLLAGIRSQQADLALQLDTTNNQISELRLSGTLTNGATRVLQAATTPMPPWKLRLPFTGGAGALAGLLAGGLVVASSERRHPKLRRRNELAAAAGAPVLASLATRPCASVRDYVNLIEHYEPTVVDAWALRRVLLALGLEAPANVELRVMLLSGDRGALAGGVQLALAAASRSLETMLLVDSKDPSAADLRGACLSVASNTKRQHLKVSDGAGGPRRKGKRARLTVSLVPLSHHHGQSADPTQPVVHTLIAVSAGFATAEQLARIALHAADAGLRAEGVLVADPDPADATVGSLPHAGLVVAPQPIRTLPNPGFAQQ